jgi:probable HAF family extracellular repeat protein
MSRRLSCLAAIAIAATGCADQNLTTPPLLRPKLVVSTSGSPIILPQGAVALNDSGWVAGNSSEGAYLWREDRPIQYLPGVAYGIGNAGQVVGEAGIAGPAFIWNNGVLTVGKLTPCCTSDEGAAATSINSNGHVTGTSTIAANSEEGFRQHVFLWVGDQLQDLGALGLGGCEYILQQCATFGNPGDGNAIGYSINDNDDIAGAFRTLQSGAFDEHAFVWTGGQMHDIGTLGGVSSRAKQINNAGQVAGSAQKADGSWRAFLWASGSMLDLGTLGGSNSWGWGVTADGKVVGESQITGDTELHIFLWSTTDGMEDLGILGGVMYAGGYDASGSSTTAIALNKTLRLLVSRNTGAPYTPTQPELYQLTFSPTNTSVGSNVSVVPVNPVTGEPAPIELSFNEVLAAGSTTVRTNTVGEAGSPPNPTGFQLGNPATYYDISSGATFSGAITLCIDYAGIAYGNESELRLLHYENGAWVDITSQGYPNTATKHLCGLTSSLSPFLVAEKNQAPVVGSILLVTAPISVGSATGVSATFSDLNPRDSHTGSFIWADGSSSPASIVESGGSGSASGTHTYSAAGVYAVTASISDGALTGSRSSESDIPAYLVVYDPAGGFITGGGWINSPAGAYSSDAGAIGKATFGFVSKYPKGKTVPEGNTEFHFATAKFKFTSASYDWLVVSGAKARFKGAGKVNGEGTYRFLIAAIDGQVSQGGGTDRFRIKIWDDATGVVVYDNQRGGPDDADPTSTLGGGSIVIQK